MNRRGASLIVVIAMLGIIGILMTVDLAGRARRVRDDGERMARVRAREWAIGATALARGGSVRCGEWLISRSPDGESDALVAESPRGLYRIERGGGEIWTRGARTRIP
ncbi:MAG: hypothetical protein H0V44_14245 [Planctomycetes bacterium]|nr:hypothetical protein [Planctomycetota bacterium]